MKNAHILRTSERHLPETQRRQIVPIIQEQDGTTLIGVCRWLNAPLTDGPVDQVKTEQQCYDWKFMGIVLAVAAAAVVVLLVAGV